ncbi:MAG TPA: hypothetical protein VFW11_21375 [Cyclobacteriaceae bacterium]|nr:hypothetical protein [Cyclobacteriaceae bacterium]
MKIIPPSPDAAALGKYGDIPVSLYTGIPDISIPLFTLEGRQLAVPIGLSYHAGGNRVEEISSWIGLGFSLNAGGVITRTVRGLKDESSAGYTNISDTDYNGLFSCSSSIADEIVEGMWDSQPDLFYFNVNGVSGKFYFDHHGDIKLETPQFYKLTPQSDGEDILSWELITDDGTTYYFESVELTRTRSSQTGPYEFYNTSWYLTKIVSPNKLEEVQFEYDLVSTPDIDINWSSQSYTSFNSYAGECPDGEILSCASYETNSRLITLNNVRRLRKITTARHEAIFDARFERLDVPGTEALTEIIIKNKEGDILKSFLLSHDHFVSNGGTGEDKYRLKLLSVKEISYQNSIVTGENPPYEFNYNVKERLPHRKSNAQDYWGFFNNKVSNTSLIPMMLYEYNNEIFELAGADREAYGTFSHANILTEITYPTGGRTVFEYEPHVYSYVYPNLISEPIFENREAVVDASGQGTPCEEMGDFVLSSYTFQLNADQIVRIYGTIDQCTPALGSLAPRVWLEDNNGNQLKLYILGKDDATGSIDEYIELTAGTYQLHARTRLYNDRASATLHYKEQVGTTHLKTAGGARIKRISSYPNGGSPALVKEYNYNESEDISSGVLVTKPIFTHTQINEKHNECPTDYGSFPQNYQCSYVVRSSHTQLPLGMTSGSHVGYKKVTVTSSGNGKEVSQYTSAMDYPDSGDEIYPFVAKTNNDWARGKILIHEIFNEQGDLLKRTSNEYNFLNYGGAKGFVLRKPYPWSSLNIFECKEYDQLTAFAQLDETLEETFTSTGTLTQTTTYSYDPINGQLPVTITTTSSKGEVTVKNIKYPFDGGAISGLTTGALAALDQMVIANRVGTPVETISTLGSLTDRKDRTNFKIENVTNPDYPAVTTMIVKDNRQTALDGSNYRTIEHYQNYDSNGNPQEYEGKDGIRNSFIWHPVDGKVLAYAENSSSNDIAYSSFEDDAAKGNWTYVTSNFNDGKVGRSSHVLNASSISKSGLDIAQVYIVSFWAKDGSPSVTNVASSNDAPQPGADGWQYFEKTIANTSQVAISGSGQTLIDELRIFPLGARMITYNYNPGQGLSCTVDYNNNTTYYEYDDFRRLKLIKDHKGNILKHYEYNYQKR